MLKDKEHSKPTPPKGKPSWLRKGIASLAAFATLATGGLVAVSSANAIDNSGNGVIIGGGGSGNGIEFLRSVAQGRPRRHRCGQPAHRLGHEGQRQHQRSDQ